MNLRNLLTVFAVWLLLASCTSGTEGIFASIEREQKIVDAGNLSNTSTITHMAEFNGRYYAAGGGALFHRATGTSSWDSTSSLNGTGNRKYVAVGKTTTHLFVLVNEGATATNKVFSSSDASTWTDITPAGFIPVSLVPIRNRDGITSDQLVVTASDFRNVFLISGGSVGSAVDLVTGGGNEITAAAKSGTDYYLVNESRIYHLPNFGSVSVVDTSAFSSLGHGYRGLIILSGTSMDGVYLSTNRGSIVKGTVADIVDNTWTTATILEPAARVGTDTVAFDQFLYQGISGSESLWVGTTFANVSEGYGYGSISTGGVVTKNPPAGTNSNNYTSSKLNSYTTPLLFMGGAAPNGTYFLGTAAHGLWSWDPVNKSWSPQ